MSGQRDSRWCDVMRVKLEQAGQPIVSLSQVTQRLAQLSLSKAFTSGLMQTPAGLDQERSRPWKYA